MDAPPLNELARQRIRDRFENDPEVKGTTFDSMVKEYHAAEDEFNVLASQFESFEKEREEYERRRKKFVLFRDDEPYGKTYTKGEFHKPDVKKYPDIPERPRWMTDEMLVSLQALQREKKTPLGERMELNQHISRVNQEMADLKVKLKKASSRLEKAEELSKKYWRYYSAFPAETPIGYDNPWMVIDDDQHKATDDHSSDESLHSSDLSAGEDDEEEEEEEAEGNKPENEEEILRAKQELEEHIGTIQQKAVEKSKAAFKDMWLSAPEKDKVWMRAHGYDLDNPVEKGDEGDEDEDEEPVETPKQARKKQVQLTTHYPTVNDLKWDEDEYQRAKQKFDTWLAFLEKNGIGKTKFAKIFRANFLGLPDLELQYAFDAFFKAVFAQIIDDTAPQWGVASFPSSEWQDKLIEDTTERINNNDPDVDIAEMLENFFTDLQTLTAFPTEYHQSNWFDRHVLSLSPTTFLHIYSTARESVTLAKNREAVPTFYDAWFQVSEIAQKFEEEQPSAASLDIRWGAAQLALFDAGGRFFSNKKAPDWKIAFWTTFLTLVVQKSSEHASPSMVPFKKRSHRAHPYTLTDPDTGVLTFLAPSPAELKQGDLDMPGAAVTRQTSAMVRQEVQNYILAEVVVANTFDDAKTQMVINWSGLKTDTPSTHIRGWVDGFVEWLDHWWWKTHNGRPSRNQLAEFTRYENPSQRLTEDDWRTIFGSQQQSAAVPASATKRVSPPPRSGSSQRSGGGEPPTKRPNAPTTVEEHAQAVEDAKAALNDLESTRDNEIREQNKKLEELRSTTSLARTDLEAKQEAFNLAGEAFRSATETFNLADETLRQFESKAAKTKTEYNRLLEESKRELGDAQAALETARKVERAASIERRKKAQEQAQEAVIDLTRAEQAEAQRKLRRQTSFEVQGTGEAELAHKQRQKQEQRKKYPPNGSVTAFFALYGINTDDVVKFIREAPSADLVPQYASIQDKKQRWNTLYQTLKKFLRPRAGSVVDFNDMQRFVPVFQNKTWLEFITEIQPDTEPSFEVLESQISFLGCAMCAKPKAKTKAGCCGQLRYCGQRCADAHWTEHAAKCSK